MAYSPLEVLYSVNTTSTMNTGPVLLMKTASRTISTALNWNAASSYCITSELTLTFLPYGYKFLKEYNDKSLEDLEKFLDFMRYHLLDYVEYISVREFQKNGRIYFHLTSFCLNWFNAQIRHSIRGEAGGWNSQYSYCPAPVFVLALVLQGAQRSNRGCTLWLSPEIS